MERSPYWSVSERYRSIKYFIRSSVMIKFNKICPPLSCSSLRYEHQSKIHKKTNFQRNEMQINFDEFLSRFAPEFLAINVLPKNIMIKVNKSVILFVALYGCETVPPFQEKIICWGVFGKQVADEDNLTLAAESRTGENCVMKRLIIWTIHLTFRVTKLRRTGREERVAHVDTSERLRGFGGATCGKELNCREVRGFGGVIWGKELNLKKKWA